MLRRVKTVGWVCGMLLVVAVSGSAQEQTKHTKDSLDTVRMNLAEKKAVLFDVREQKEWDEGRLEGARLVPLSKLRDGAEAKLLVPDLDPKSIIYCHCRAGGRAITAAEILRKQGYDVRPLKQGYEELIKAGLPKAKSPENK